MRKKIKIWYLDIETRVTRNEFPAASKALEQISLIQIVRKNDIVVFGTRELINFKEFEYPTKYIKSDNEIEMLNKFLDFLNKDKPTIVYAWNGKRFDFPYIFNRLKNLNIDTDRMHYTDDTIKYIDLMLLYKKHGDKLESYSLDSVSKHEVGDKKVEHDEFLDFDSFYTGEKYEINKEPYEDEIRESIRQLKILEQDNKLNEDDSKKLNNLIFFNYISYGIKDSILLKKIDEHKNLTSFVEM